ncbi:SAM-dependent methyltransferase [Gottfriedia sp. OAE603]|uniref:SAM-dependent methyltransferase n=1 Tax=Gottfriedia sp. OAE603 TaxID=2663872 RepID=UPI00348BD0CF
MKKIILNAIQKSGKNYITYEEFISLCLYHSDKGYYQKSDTKIGRKGDFYTTSSVGTVYGEVIASVFCRLIKNEVIDPIFIEVGAGNGRFANSFLTYCKKNEPTIYANLEYRIVDESKYHRSLQMKALLQHTNVSYYSSISDLSKIQNGLIFSNELFDALPVRVVEFCQNKWQEVVISYNETNDLIEKFIEIENDSTFEFLKYHHFSGKHGQRVEIPIAMESVFKGLNQVLDHGIIMTVDYGFTKDEWNAPHRVKGSLRGYHQHEMKTNVFEFLGEMDLTTHIHWDELRRLADMNHLENLYFHSQRQALIDFGILNWLVQHASMNPFSDEYKNNRAIQSLIMPGGISDSFQLLLQIKGFF